MESNGGKKMKTGRRGGAVVVLGSVAGSRRRVAGIALGASALLVAVLVGWPAGPAGRRRGSDFGRRGGNRHPLNR
jgi:hypothetical protein